jgi:class 3 adenylate cyclase/tetratricopeptide (TPR) repeat protein
LRREEESALLPTRKPDPDQTEGDIAVQSDSSAALPAPAVDEPRTESDFDLTTALTPQRPAGAAIQSETPPAPKAFGRYQVRKTLGSGGFGSVYLGHDTELDRPVAIKVLRGRSRARKGEAGPLLQEARRLARLSHPGIVSVHDVGLEGDQVYIVSDFLDGPDLARWLADARPAWPDAARVAAAVADALAHAHARSIVHRDVKPANIILTPDRGPVLVDFGLGLDEAVAGGSGLGDVSGTPAYMAPEQVAGAAHRIDGRTDIYSLGVVLYEMLCGRVPFRASHLAELLRQVRDDDPQPPRQLRRDIPQSLERACLKALAKRFQDRFTTATDFAEELRLAQQSATPPGSMTASGFFSGSTRMGHTLAPESATAIPSSSFSTTSRRRAREAERRQVTVLVCGCALFESESYLETLDAEEQAAILRAFQQRCDQAVLRFEGTVIQRNDDGMLACFGYPVAFEDAASRAALAGLGLLKELTSLSERLGRPALELNPWVGIHTGPAIAEAGEESVSLVGEARNVAVRLGDIAEPGQIVCTAATHRLIRAQFDCTGLGHRKVKGVSQSVELFLIEGVSKVRDSIEASERAALSPLTGRDHEVSLLKDRWEQAQEGMGQVVLLIGEPGLGKSRLVDTLKQHVLGQTVEGEVDAPVIEWRCSPHYQNTGLYPAISFYERALGSGREEPPQARFDRLLERLESYQLARPETVPLWASLLSMPAPDRFPPLSLSPARQREETFRVMLDWLRTRAARRPILFVVEDLHWVDASTLEFLGQFLGEGLHDSLLALLTFRPEFQTPWPALAHQTTLALNRLTRRQAGDLMRKKTGAAVPESVIDQIFDRTGGVPFFVEEFTKMVQESGALHRSDEPGEQAVALTPREIPPTLQDLITARLDRMEGEREVAQICAVLGREFSHELLAAVVDIPEAALQAELAKLAHAEILYPKGRPPRCSYLFKHALLEDALYNALVKDKRQQIHRRIAEVLEAQFPQTVETQPELLAHHFTEASLHDRAVGYWLKAGLRSRERAADREAIGHLTRGLALLEPLEETREHAELRLKILTTLGPASIAVRGYAAPEVGPMLLRAGELCQRIGDEPQQFGILLGRWEWNLVRGDLQACIGLADEGMALAERLNDPGMLMEALFMPGVTMFYRGRFAEARAFYEKALASFDDRERTRFWTAYTGHNAGVTHRCYLALALWHLGYPDQALRLDHETQELARSIGHAFSLGHAVDFRAFLYRDCRLGAQALSAAEEEAAIATEQGFQLWLALGTLHKGAALLLQGRREEAMPLLLKGYSAFRATGAEVRAPAYLALLGDAYTQLGRFEEARNALDQGLAIAEKNDDRFHEAELHRLKGEQLLAESPDQTAAPLDCFRRAAAIAQTQQSKAWELRAAMSLARLRQRQGDREDARATLSAVFSTYTEGFTTPDLVDAKALLEALA